LYWLKLSFQIRNVVLEVTEENKSECPLVKTAHILWKIGVELDIGVFNPHLQHVYVTHGLMT